MAQETHFITRSVMTTLLTSVLLAALSLAMADAAGQPKPLQIGMAKTFLAEQPKSFVQIATDDFKDVLKKTTGLAGDIASKYTAVEMAEKLDSKQLDLGIFHAHEFAALQKKNADLQPLLIAANKRHAERAYLIVHKTNAAKTLADLAGKKLDMPIGTKEHCRLFLVKRCADEAKKSPAAFFAAIAKSAAPMDALDAVAQNKAQATVVDTNTLEFYKEIKEAVFAKNLRVLQESEVFPPAVIVYKPGALAEATLKQFRDGLLKAHTVAEGREMMKSWNIDAFEPIPKDYPKSLADVLKAYPAATPER